MHENVCKQKKLLKKMREFGNLARIKVYICIPNTRTQIKVYKQKFTLKLTSSVEPSESEM